MKKRVPLDAILIPDAATRVFQGVIYDVYQWQQELFDGSMATFEGLKRPDTVVALCVVDDKVVVLTDTQPHRGTRRNFPGGRVDQDEDVLCAAKREVREETGYEFVHWQLVDVKQPLTKIEWFVHQYVAWGVSSKTSPHLDPGERITLRLLPFAEIRTLVSAKDSYMSESKHIVDMAGSIKELLELPVFVGKEVDRS